MPHPSEPDLRALLDGGLDPDRAETVSDHLDACPDCRDVAERLTAVPHDLWAALAVEGGRPRSGVPTVPGYEDLEELGRGGCGVVYRAFERAAGRVVALKVLRAGALASPAEHAWFLAEARAAARLRHPNVLGVLAVGESYELPYYAMDYMPAGSLAARLDGAPMAPAEAARLVAAVADGVQHAHENGVIHRDLKPGNILLDAPPGGGPAAPRVSDFGMAKQADSSRSATPSQAVLGTPSYMAPEQAMGRSRDVGPAADVYALGAVLYELLTGRPPFRGASPYETLLQVGRDEPVPPRRLRAGLPADLDVICLKCLDKDPRRRYPSARAMADDLRAFLGRRPIAARPLGPIGRLARWARRERKVAALVGTSLLLLVAGLVATTALWRRAESRGADVRRLLASYTRSTHLLLRNPQLLSVEERADLAKAVEDYQAHLSEVAGDAAEERRMAYETLQLAAGIVDLGDRATAGRMVRRAVAVLGRLGDEGLEYRHDYAEGCSQLGNLLATGGREDEARPHFEEAVRVLSDLVALSSGRDKYRGALAGAQTNLAQWHNRHGDPAGAETLYRESLAINRDLVARYPEDPMRYQYFNWACRGLAWLLMSRGDREGHLALMREQLELARRMRDHPNWPRIARNLIGPDLARAMDEGGWPDDAARVLAWGRELAARAAAERPNDQEAAVEYASWLAAEGSRRRPSEPDAARELFRRAIGVLSPWAGGPPGPAAADLAWMLAVCPDPSLRDPARALALVPLAEGPPAYPRLIAGAALFELGRYDEAIRELDACLAVAGSAAPDFWRGSALAYRALTLRKLGDATRAEADFLAATAALKDRGRWEWDRDLLRRWERDEPAP